MDSPVERIEGQDTELGIVVAVATHAEEELSQLRDVLTEGDLKDEKGLENVEELTGASLVAALNTLTDDVDHRRKEVLESFLESREPT